MEVTVTEDADTLDSESGITAEIIDADVDSFTPKSSPSDEIKDSESNRPKIQESESIIAGQTLDSLIFLPTTSSPNSESIEISSASNETEDLEALSNCETPNDNIFNPFAHGPDELALAPKKKTPRKIEISTCRQLNFDDCCESEGKVDSNGYILDSIYESFPKLIVSTQVNDIVGDNISNGFTTPTSVPLLTGIADTCPGAPMRPASKLRKLDQSSFRKLEFGNHLR